MKIPHRSLPCQRQQWSKSSYSLFTAQRWRCGEFLNRKFPGWWIGRGVEWLAWAPRSPDFTSLDIFLLGLWRTKCTSRLWRTWIICDIKLMKLSTSHSKCCWMVGWRSIIGWTSAVSQGGVQSKLFECNVKCKSSCITHQFFIKLLLLWIMCSLILLNLQVVHDVYLIRKCPIKTSPD